jgi:hypothetical protein
VQHCFLSLDREAVRPLQNLCTMPPPLKYLWTLRVGAPRIRLEGRRRTCDAEHDGAFAPQRTSFGALLRRAGPDNRSRQKTRKPLSTKNTKIIFVFLVVESGCQGLLVSAEPRKMCAVAAKLRRVRRHMFFYALPGGFWVRPLLELKSFNSHL